MARGRENLKPARSKDEARKRGAAGGRKSGEVRREKKAIRARIMAMLDGREDDGSDTRDAIAAAILKKAKGGDLRAIEMVMAVAGESLDAVNFTMPRGKEDDLPALSLTILRRVADGRITPGDAAAISSLLGTHIQAVRVAADLSPDDPTGGDYRTVSDEEMEARVLARKQELEAQKAALPERREAMQALHAQVADHFAPDSTGAQDGRS